MGASSSTYHGGIRYLRRRSMRNLKGSTHFSFAELHDLRRAFYKDYPEGKLSRHHFQQVFVAFFPFDFEACKFGEHLFRSFDTDADGFLSFDDFVLAMSFFQHGTKSEKLDWVFRMYDVDGDGVITRDEMSVVMSSFLQIRELEADISDADSFDSICEQAVLGSANRRRRVSCMSFEKTCDLFDLLDENGTGEISRRDFLEISMKDELVQSSVLSSLDFRLEAH